MENQQYCMTRCDEEEAGANCMGFNAPDQGKVGTGSKEETLKAPALPFRLLAEFVGTALLITVGCGAVIILNDVESAFVGQVLSWGAVLVVLIFMFRNVSGAHFNPAMTLAFALNRDITIRDAVAYAAVQCMGALAASFLLVFLVQPGIEGATLGAVAGTVVHDGIGVWRGLFIETLLTAILSSSIFLSTSKEFGAGNLAPLVIGLALVSDILLGAVPTGASMNPARSLGPALSHSAMQGAPSESLRQLWLYVVGPCIGACLGLAFYQLLSLGSKAANRSSMNHRRAVVHADS